MWRLECDPQPLSLLPAAEIVELLNAFHHFKLLGFLSHQPLIGSVSTTDISFLTVTDVDRI